MRCLYSLDFASIKPSFLIENPRRYSTTIGLVFSCLTVLISIVIFGLFLELLISKKFPNITPSTFYQKYLEIKVDKNFPFSTSILQMNGKLIPDPEIIFSVKAAMIYNKFEDLNGSVSLKIINQFYEMKKCTQDSFGYYLGIFNTSRWKNLYCLNYDEIKDLSIINPKANRYDFSQFKIVLDKCDNSTMNNKCRPLSEINKY